MQTQPLSNCVLRACAYQRTRQRNIGIAKKSCQGFWRLFGKGRMFGRPFFKTNPQELSTPVYLPRKLLNNTKNASINKTLSITTLAQYFILQLRRNIPLTTMTSIVFCLEIMQSKEMHQLLGRTWGGMILKGIFSSNFWNLRMLKNNLLNWGMYADRCSPLEVGAPRRLWSGF